MIPRPKAHIPLLDSRSVLLHSRYLLTFIKCNFRCVLQAFPSKLVLAAIQTVTLVRYSNQRVMPVAFTCIA